MNARAHWLSLLTAIVHLTTGISQLTGYGPPFIPPSWATLYELSAYANEVWLGLYTLVGVVAAVGVWKSNALRVSCWLATLLYLVWGLVGLYNTWRGAPGGNIPGSLTNLQLAGAMFVLAYYVNVGVRGDEIDERLPKLAEAIKKVQSNGPE